MTKILSIDPGLRGCYVVLNNGQISDYRLTQSDPLTEAEGSSLNLAPLYELLDANPDLSCAVLEQPQLRPDQSVVAAGNAWRGVGRIEGYLDRHGLKTVLICPQEWTSRMWAMVPSPVRKANPTNENKELSKYLAQRLYPNFNFIPMKKRVVHDGLCDAVLIGFYFLWKEGWIAKYKEKLP